MRVWVTTRSGQRGYVIGPSSLIDGWLEVCITDLPHRPIRHIRRDTLTFGS